MTTSYTDYRGRGFWADDTVIELWLHLLVEAGPTRCDTAWIGRARDDWAIQASVGFLGSVNVALDDHLAGDPTRESEFVTLVNEFDNRLASLGPTIPAAIATSYHVGGGTEFIDDVDVGVLRQFSAALIGLVTTRRTEPASDPS
jgi:hypothetical protein